MFDMFMSAGSLLDFGSTPQQNLNQLRRRQLTRAGKPARIDTFSLSDDSQNLSGDWHAIGQDMKNAMGRFATDNQFVATKMMKGTSHV